MGREAGDGPFHQQEGSTGTARQGPRGQRGGRIAVSSACCQADLSPRYNLPPSLPPLTHLLHKLDGGKVEVLSGIPVQHLPALNG